MATLNDFREWGRYFSPPIQRSWDTFIDLLLSLTGGSVDGPFLFDTSSVVMGDPGAGYIRANNLTPSLITKLAVSETQSDLQSALAILANLRDQDTIILQSNDNSGVFYAFICDGDPTDQGDWWEINVTYTDASVTPLADEEAIQLVAIIAAGTFTGLRDTPNSYTGYAGQIPMVNQSEDALEFSDFLGAWKNPTGFENTNQDTTIGIEEVGLDTKFYIQPNGASYNIYINGVVYTKSGKESITLPTLVANTTHYVLFDSAGTLQVESSPSFEDLIRDNVFVAILYYTEPSGDDGSKILVLDERHGLMPWQTHLWLHVHTGTIYRSGLGLVDVTSGGSGSLDADAEFGAAVGIIMDEDINHSLSAIDSSTGDWPVLYRSGDGWCVVQTGDPSPVILTGGVPQYNLDTAGSWSLEDVGTAKFFLMHIFATAGKQIWLSPTLTALPGYFAILGQAEYSTLTAARDGATEEISNLVTAGLPMPEFLAVATVIFKRGGTNAYNCAVQTTAEGDDYVSWLVNEISPGSPPTSHANTTGRELTGQHPATAIDYGLTHEIPELVSIHTADKPALRIHQDVSASPDTNNNIVKLVADQGATAISSISTPGVEVLISGKDNTDGEQEAVRLTWWLKKLSGGGTYIGLNEFSIQAVNPSLISIPPSPGWVYLIDFIQNESTGYIELDSIAPLGNERYLEGISGAGNKVNLIGMNANDQCVVGGPGVDDVVLQTWSGGNDRPFYWKSTTPGDQKEIALMEDLPGGDTEAIHDNVAAEINALTSVTAATDDIVLIEDQSDSWNKKKVTVASIAAQASTDDPDAIHDNVANEISALTEKTTPADDDILIIEDSAASYVKKKVKMANLPGGSTPAAPGTTAATATDVNPPGIASYGWWDILNITSKQGYVVFLKNIGPSAPAGHWTQSKITVDGTVIIDTSLDVDITEIYIGQGSVLDFVAPIYFSSSIRIEVYSYRTSSFSKARLVYQEW